MAQQGRPTEARPSGHPPPAVAVASAVEAQVRLVLTKATPANLKMTAAELLSIKKYYGDVAAVHILRSLAESVDFSVPRAAQSHPALLSLLPLELAALLPRPNFGSCVLRALERISTVSQFLFRFCEVVQLPFSLKLALGLAFAFAAEPNRREHGSKFVVACLSELQQQAVPADGLPPSVLHGLACFVRAMDAAGKRFLPVLQALAARSPHSSLAVRALLDESRGSDSRWSFEAEAQQGGRVAAQLQQRFEVEAQPARLMHDLGYGCCSSAEQFQRVLSRFPYVDDLHVALMVGTMCRTHTDLEGGADLQEYSATGDWSSNEKQASSEAKPTSWNVEAFVAACNKTVSGLNWHAVMRKLDYAGFAIADAKGLALLFTIYSTAAGEAFPLDVLLADWKEKDGQLSLLRLLLTPTSGAPFLEHLNFATTPQIALQESGAPKPGKHLGLAQVRACWLSLALLEALLRVAGTVERHEAVKGLFEYPLKHCPEALVIGLAQVAASARSALHAELASMLVRLFLGSHPNSSFVLHRLWPLDRGMVVRGMVELYAEDRSSISRILDIAQELKVLASVLEARPFTFAIELAALASRREYLFLEKWLQDNVEAHGEAFVRACVRFIKEKTHAARGRASSRPADASKTMPPQLASETLQVFLTCLGATATGNTGNVGPEVAEDIRQLQAGSHFRPEVEERANEIFKEIYTSKISLDEAIALLKRFAAAGAAAGASNEAVDGGTDSKEGEIFACMIHNLFDEYRYFHKYPDKELRITGILFGSLIQHQLVHATALGHALRSVLDGLQQSRSSKMFKFGMYALNCFKQRLHEWPKYCGHILQIAHVRQYHPDVISYIEAALAQSPKLHGPPGLAGPEPPVREETTATSMGGVAGGVGGGAAVGGAAAPGGGDKGILRGSIPIDTLLNTTPFAQVVPPDQESEDRILFVFNNVSMQNIDTKVRELRALLNEELYPWLAQYIVVKRASIEHNFHDVYLAFLAKLGLADLERLVVAATYHNVRALLRSRKITSNQSERTLLKNLGRWLGSLTLAKDKPLLHEDLVLRDLLYEAYETGRLVAVAPFVAKVLESCARSTVFKPSSNVWTMRQLQYLAELYTVPRLKLNLKFEIELLCNTLEVDLKQIRPTANLHQYELCPPPNPDVHPPKPSDAALVQPPQRNFAEEERNQGLPQPGQLAHAPSLLHSDTTRLGEAGQQQLMEGQAGPSPVPLGEDASIRVSFDPSIVLFASQPHLKKMVPMGIDRAIREIITPVVDRSVTIACTTTRELVIKDWLLEPEEARIKEAALLMVQSLAGSLAQVTCKDLLRVSIANHMRSLLQGHDQAQIIDQVAQKVTLDNLDMACRIIERAAVEKAMVDLDEGLSAALAVRAQRGARLSAFAAQHLPDALRVQPGGLLPHQAGVYSDFARLLPLHVRNMAPALAKRVAGPGQISHMEGEAAGQQQQQQQAPHPPQQQVQQQPQVQLGQGQSAAEKSRPLIASIDEIIVRNAHAPLAKMPTEHQLIKCIRRIPLVISQSKNPEEAAVSLAKFIFFHLYGLDSPSPGERLARPSAAPLPGVASQLHRDVYLTSLEGIQALCGATRSEITRCYILHLPEAAKLCRDIVPRLLQSRLVHYADFDVHMAELVHKEAERHMQEQQQQQQQGQQGQQLPVLDFALFIAHRCLVEHKCLTELDLAQTLEALRQHKALQQRRSPRLKSGSDSSLPLVGAELLHQHSGLPLSVPSPATELDFGKALARAAACAPSQKQREAALAALDEASGLLSAAEGKAGAAQALLGGFVAKLRSQGLLGSEEAATAFFTACTEREISLWLEQEAHVQAPETTSTKGLDAYALLVVLLVRHHHDERPASAVGLFAHALAVLAHRLRSDHEAAPEAFNQQAYHRLLASWLMELLSGADKQLEALAWPLLQEFHQCFVALQPRVAPAFAFAWLELVSHRMFMANLLKLQAAGRPLVKRLLVALLRFLEPFLRQAQLTPPVRLLYKGTLRVLLVLLHDFPEFLCDYHFALCSVMPPACIQMRNLILSAFPRNMRLPDPFTPNLKVDLLPEINQCPRILSNHTAALERAGLLEDVDAYLATRTPSAFPSSLVARLSSKESTGESESGEEGAAHGGTAYNVAALNGLVLHIGMQAIAQLQSKVSQVASPLTHSAPMDIFQALAAGLSSEGRYLFLNAIANQLRFPNNHTHYFSCVLLHLFAETKQEIVQEQITRVLLERLIVNRPHPWGLLITFIELIKNPRYSFWSHSFTHCAPEVERLFESVARACIMPTKQGEADAPQPGQA